MIGLMKAQNLKKREQMLLEIQKLLLRFRTGISFSSKTVSELISENRANPLCAAAASSGSFIFDPCGALGRAAKEQLQTEKDKKLLSDFAAGLGTSDTEGQLKHIELYAGLLKENIKEAQEDYRNKSKLFTALGLFSGATICLVLI